MKVRPPWHADGLILYANRRFAEMVDLPLEKLIGSMLHEAVQISQCPAFDELLARAQVIPQKEECRLSVASGKRFPAYLSLSPLTGSEFQGVCLIITDLTDQKTQQAELAKSNELLKAEIAGRKRVEQALRQLTGRLLRLQDEERRRIARDLHDSTAQTLTALSLNLSLLGSEMPGDSRARQLLTESQTLAGRASDEIRNLSHLLHPPELDKVGLIAAIRWHCSQIGEMTGIEVILDLPRDVQRLPRDIETALFRVLQESLENVRRHSGSLVARVWLTREEEKVVLTIEDQGRGVPPGVLTDGDQSAAGLGVGVAGMRERLRQLGGRLEIESGSHGTVVAAIVPLRTHSPQ